MKNLLYLIYNYFYIRIFGLYLRVRENPIVHIHVLFPFNNTFGCYKSSTDNEAETQMEKKLSFLV